MINLIIDSASERYQPQVILSELDPFEVNLAKFKKVYIFIDNIGLFEKVRYSGDHIIYLMKQDVAFQRKDVLIKKINDQHDDQDFRQKIIKQSYIYNFLFKDISNVI